MNDCKIFSFGKLIYYLILHTLNNAVMNLFVPKSISGCVSILYFAKLLSQKLVSSYTLINRVGTGACPMVYSPDLQYLPGFLSIHFVRVKMYFIASTSLLFFFHIREDEHF